MNKNTIEATEFLDSKAEMDTLKPPKLGLQNKSYSVNDHQKLSVMPEISFKNVSLPFSIN